MLFYQSHSSKSQNSPIEHILFLHRTIGNHAVQRLFKPSIIQAKLKIGKPGDIYEQEADRISKQVMRMPEPGVQRQEEEEEEPVQAKTISEQTTPSIQRQNNEEEEEEIQTKAISHPSIPVVQKQTEEEEEEEEIQTKPLSNQVIPFVQRQTEEEQEEETIQAKSFFPVHPNNTETERAWG